ncbi:MAG TPA: SLBB domain-containing protein, partial [Chthonomonadales bacterium]|nr:SLBB domain-containing protein [Chthonomonadales bacterium]
SPTSPAEVAAPIGEARELVSRPRVLSPEELSPSGNIAIDLVAALKQPAGEADILMVDGDMVTIPVKPTTVQVVGAVIHPRGVPFQKGADLNYYLTAAGGYTPDAARDRVIVVRLGGGLTPIKKLKALKPGDIILVPTRVMAQRITNRVAEIDAIFRGLTTSTLLILGVKKLLGL